MIMKCYFITLNCTRHTNNNKGRYHFFTVEICRLYSLIYGEIWFDYYLLLDSVGRVPKCGRLAAASTFDQSSKSLKNQRHHRITKSPTCEVLSCLYPSEQGGWGVGGGFDPINNHLWLAHPRPCGWNINNPSANIRHPSGKGNAAVAHWPQVVYPAERERERERERVYFSKPTSAHRLTSTSDIVINDH